MVVLTIAYTARMTMSRAVVIAEIVSLVAALILVGRLAARFTHTGGPAFWPILVYAAIRLFVRVAVRFKSAPARAVRSWRGSSSPADFNLRSVAMGGAPAVATVPQPQHSLARSRDPRPTEQ